MSAVASHHRKYGTDADLADPVTISLEERGKRLTISVRDQGVPYLTACRQICMTVPRGCLQAME